MESHPYSYGTKLTGLILHLFFTVVLTIAVFLLASMLSKNIFELSDVGTEQFLDSGYYTKCIEKKCDDLSYFYGNGLCMIEWANLIEEILPEKRHDISIEKDLEKGFDYRKIIIRELD